jgi:hypothetical protein
MLLKRSSPLYRQELKKWLREKYNWTLPRKNVGALVDEEVRLSLEKVILGYKFPFKDSKYFCSKLVTELLERTQLYHFDGHPGAISRTLREACEIAEWTDIPISIMLPIALTSRLTPHHQHLFGLAYRLTLEEIVLTLRQMGITSVVDLLAAGTKKVTKISSTSTNLLMGWAWATAGGS